MGHHGVVLFTLGGTIAMAGDEGGVVTRLSGTDLTAGIAELSDVDIRDVRRVPSADLTFALILDVVEAAADAVAAGAVGVVLTQGTDTLEETAFLIDCVWPYDAPFVITGAMRNPTLPGADGPANVLAAVQVAAAPATRGLGALVVFSDEIHAARFVRKTHTSSTDTFASPDLGPLGRVVEGVPRILGRVARRAALPPFTRAGLAATRVPLYPITLDDDGEILTALHASGLVVSAFGVGHVPQAFAPLLGDLAARMPVVLTSRTGAGPVLADTYGAPGSERDLRERGLISGGFVHPYKARVLLRLLLAAGADRSRIAQAFADIG